jgi:hypothetical protein
MTVPRGRCKRRTPTYVRRRRSLGTGKPLAPNCTAVSIDRAPASWGLRMFNGAGEQQLTTLLPNPFLSAEGDKLVQAPDWSRLALVG